MAFTTLPHEAHLGTHLFKKVRTTRGKILIRDLIQSFLSHLTLTSLSLSVNICYMGVNNCAYFLGLLSGLNEERASALA